MNKIMYYGTQEGDACSIQGWHDSATAIDGWTWTQGPVAYIRQDVVDKSVEQESKIMEKLAQQFESLMDLAQMRAHSGVDNQILALQEVACWARAARIVRAAMVENKLQKDAT